MSRVMHYACDTCGMYFAREPASMMECPNGECQSTRLWEFDRKDKALQHAHDIQGINRTRLFRSAV